MVCVILHHTETNFLNTPNGECFSPQFFIIKVGVYNHDSNREDGREGKFPSDSNISCAQFTIISEFF